MERSAGTCTGNWDFQFGAFYHFIQTCFQCSSHQRFQDDQSTGAASLHGDSPSNASSVPPSIRAGGYVRQHCFLRSIWRYAIGSNESVLSQPLPASPAQLEAFKISESLAWTGSCSEAIRINQYQSILCSFFAFAYRGFLKWGIPNTISVSTWPNDWDDDWGYPHGLENLHVF